MKAIYIVCYLCVVSPIILFAQEGCSPDYVRVFGSLIRDEMELFIPVKGYIAILPSILNGLIQEYETIKRHVPLPW